MIATLHFKKCFIFILLTIFLLGILSTIGQIAKYYFGHDYLFGFVPLFNLSSEKNIPTWFSSILLLSCAILIVIITSQKINNNDKYLFHWKLLGIVFLYLSIDESAAIHEKISGILQNTLHLSGYLKFAWVIPALIIVIILGIGYFKFFLSLPSRTRVTFTIAASLYIIGALIFEFFEGQYVSIHGWDTFTYTIIWTVEEMLEMIGLTIFLYGLIKYYLIFNKKIEILIDL